MLFDVSARLPYRDPTFKLHGKYFRPRGHIGLLTTTHAPSASVRTFIVTIVERTGLTIVFDAGV